MRCGCVRSALSAAQFDMRRTQKEALNMTNHFESTAGPRVTLTIEISLAVKRPLCCAECGSCLRYRNAPHLYPASGHRHAVVFLTITLYELRPDQESTGDGTDDSCQHTLHLTFTNEGEHGSLAKTFATFISKHRREHGSYFSSRLTQN